MKKFFFTLVVSTIFCSCLSNPQQTQQDHIMDHEKETNAIEFQKNPIDTVPQGATATFDSTHTQVMDTTEMNK